MIGHAKVLGFHRLICKNRSCQHVLKIIEFIEGWKTRVRGESLVIVQTKSERYYVCPKCKAKNFVILEGENVILEKIVSYELPKHEL